MTLPFAVRGPSFLPTSAKEIRGLGWDAVDVVFVTGDAYVDHPSFAMAVLGRVLESRGFRVAILPQPDWRSADAAGGSSSSWGWRSTRFSSASCPAG